MKNVIDMDKDYFERLTNKKSPSATEVWTKYIEDTENNYDFFRQYISSVIDLFINDVEFDSDKLNKTVNDYCYAMQFYNLLIKFKNAIKTAKQDVKKESYFTFKPGQSLRENNIECLGNDNIMAGPNVQIYLPENYESKANFIKNSLKFDTLLPAGTLEQMGSAEKKLNSFFEKIITFLAVNNIYKDPVYKEFPKQDKVPLFLIRYTENLFDYLKTQKLADEQILSSEVLFYMTIKPRLLVVHKIYNKIIFNKDLNLILLNKQLYDITEALPTKPVSFVTDEADPELLPDFLPWNDEDIYSYINPIEKKETQLSEKEVLSTLLYDFLDFNSAISEDLYILCSCFFNITFEEYSQKKILRKIQNSKIIYFVKRIMNYYGENLLNNPGILLLLSEQVSKIVPEDFKSILSTKTEEEKNDIKLYFDLLKKYDTQRSNTFSTGELLTKKYLNNDDRSETKKKILYSFLFYIIWNQLKLFSPLHKDDLLEDELKDYKTNPQPGLIVSKKKLQVRQDLICQMYDYAIDGKSYNPELICDVANKIIYFSIFEYDQIFQIKKESFMKLDTNTLEHMVYNLSKDITGRKYGMFREMTFISDKKKNKLPVRFDNDRTFNTKSLAENYINKIKENRTKLKNIDIGFPIALIQPTISAERLGWERGLLIKLFPDTDKEYYEAKVENRKGKHYVNGGAEKYRLTNSNHLNNFYMYEAMRNPESHEEAEILVLSSLSNDSKTSRVEIMLESLYDCYSFLKTFSDYIEENNITDETVIPTMFYQTKFNEVTAMLSSKMENLPENQKDFLSWFDDNGNLCLNSDIYKGISYSDDEVFLKKLKNLFTDFYLLNLKDEILNYSAESFDLGVVVLMYLIYMNSCLAEY